MSEPPRQVALRRRWWLALPLLVFAGLAGLFWYALQGGDPSRLPSAMIGKEVPSFDLPPIEGLTADGAAIPGLDSAELAQGKPSIVNVWASWCVPCHEEHPLLMQLAKDKPGIRLFAINYKDDTENARRFLGRYGNPFGRVGADQSGTVAIDWGVYGVPETYVVAGDGKIIYRHVGPLTANAISKELLPLLKQGGTPTG